MATRTPSSIFAPHRVQSKTPAREHQPVFPTAKQIVLGVQAGYSDQLITGTFRGKNVIMGGGHGN